MEGKLSPQVAVCLQENLYLPVDPWEERIILFSLINFCLLLLSLHVACFRHKDTASLGFLSPMSHTQVLVVLQSSQCECLCPFLKSSGSISMPARDEGTVRLFLPCSSLFFFLSSVAWNGLLSPRGSLMLHVFLISWCSRAGFSLAAMRRRLRCHSVWFWSVRVLGPDSVLINGFSIWKYLLPFLQCFPTAMPGKGQEKFFLFPICDASGSLGALGLCCGSLLMQVSWGLWDDLKQSDWLSWLRSDPPESLPGSWAVWRSDCRTLICLSLKIKCSVCLQNTRNLLDSLFLYFQKAHVSALFSK